MGWNVKTYNYDQKYIDIIKYIDENDEFKKIVNKKHHGKSRYNHSKKVSYLSYRIARFLNLNYQETAKAGLLHDYFTEDNLHLNDRIKSLFKHPNIALNNSRKLFKLSKKEENIIISHMFPLSKNIPTYFESWIVNMVDKIVSLEELTLTTSNYIQNKTRKLTMIIPLLINFYKK